MAGEVGICELVCYDSIIEMIWFENEGFNLKVFVFGFCAAVSLKVCYKSWME